MDLPYRQLRHCVNCLFANATLKKKHNLLCTAVYIIYLPSTNNLKTIRV